MALLGRIFESIAAGHPWPGYEIGISKDEYEDIDRLIEEAERLNGWFTRQQVIFALASWAELLKEELLKSWSSHYPFAEESKRVGLIMAGNIPMVGMHDLISVLLSGHHLILRPSSDDHVLIRMVVALLTTLDEAYHDIIQWADGKLKGHEAIIATGSDNTSRYFEYYFSQVPHIIRKNRNGIAILNGQETEAELKALGQDIFQYFGLGCRNVSKIYVPEGYDLDTFFGGIYPHHSIIEHNKYANNYDYYRSVFLLNEDNILDNGFLLLKRHEALASPMASLHYERYSDEDALRKSLSAQSDQIQCIVSRKDVPFGKAQSPALDDYADGVDTMQFLAEL
ncbi:MAG: acyl-CoA reductase [Flavobacteriales bacterium]|nr:acyl-CoA reductase [Flavobacteriales bacterium]